MVSIFGLAVLVAAAAVFFAGNKSFALGDLSTDDIGRLILGAALILFVGAGLVGMYRARWADAVRHALAWGAVLLLLVTGYAYRDELNAVGTRLVAELTPEGSQMSLAETDDGAEVRIRRRFGGHFIVRGRVDETVPFEMIVDTGASTVVLRHEDARRIGIDIARLRYTVPVQTANGESRAASVRLRELTIGSIRRTNVEALVARPGLLHQSLLGMNFLNRLRSYEFARDTLVLRG